MVELLGDDVTNLIADKSKLIEPTNSDNGNDDYINNEIDEI
jgi:hypothetical protein